MAMGDVNLGQGSRPGRRPPNSGNQVRVLLGDPGGSFGAPTNFPTGTLGLGAVADFNADSKPDQPPPTPPPTTCVRCC